MNAFIEIVRLIAQLLPMVIEIIKAVESQVPESGKGQEKLALVRELLQVAYDAGDDVDQAFDEVWPTLKRVIDSVVSAFNRLGIFTKA